MNRCPPWWTAAPRWPKAPRRSGRRRRATGCSASSAATAPRSRRPSPSAAHVVELDLVNQRLHAAPIEPRAARGKLGRRDRRFDLLFTGKGVHGIRRQLATVFGLPRPNSACIARMSAAGSG